MGRQRPGLVGHRRFARGFRLYRLPWRQPEFAGALGTDDTAELFCDECRVPARNILGERDRGFYYIMENFQSERLGAALTTLAMMDRALELAREYARERKAFGQSIGDFQVWKHKFAEHLT